MVEADLLRYYQRDLIDVLEQEGCRRLWVLVNGLPADAATWREDVFDRTDELLATLIERRDNWSRALLDALMHKKQIKAPGEITIPRPGTEEAQRDRVITDPKEIAAFFGGAVKPSDSERR